MKAKSKNKKPDLQEWINSEMERIITTISGDGSGDRVLDEVFKSQQTVDGVLRMLLSFQTLDLAVNGPSLEPDLKFIRSADWVLRLWHAHRDTITKKK